MLIPSTKHKGAQLKTLSIDTPFHLESGQTIDNLQIGYHTYGKLNSARDNVVWVFHALTGNSDPKDWWSGLVGVNQLINTENYFIICVNMLGSCYGSTVPPKEYLITIKDITKANRLIRDHFGIKKIKYGIGGSMGGQQVVQWAVEEPHLFETIIPIATNAAHSPWGIAYNEAQRMALEHPDEKKGVEIARAIGMLSYRHYQAFEKTQKDSDFRSDSFSSSSYQRYQGKKLSERFTNLSYYHLSMAMDSHNVGRDFESISKALARIESNCIVIGVDTDELFPISEQQFLAENIKGASFHTIFSDYGHDGFLVETNQINDILSNEF